jgi:hypothetical protein
VADIVTLPEVQQFLEPTKLTLVAYDPELYATSREIVFSRLAAYYTTSTWIDVASTPALVRKVVAMLIAAITYQRQYSEDMPIQDENWGVKLEQMAMTLLDGIVSGAVDLDAIAVINPLSGPIFWPNDDSIDSDGCPVEAVFTMGHVF